MPAVEQIQADEVEVRRAPGIQVTRTSGMVPEAINAAMASAFHELGSFMARHPVTPIGPPRAVYTGYAAGTTFNVVFPIAAAAGVVTDPEGAVTVAELPGGRAWRFTHVGPYRNLSDTYARITEWLRERHLLETEADWATFMPMWEEYLDDPQTTPESELRTYIYLPRP